jgi:OmpA-OmpF porin, OOP family
MIARSGFAVAAVLCAALAVPAPAAADPMAIGGWIGPRFFSDDSALGYITDAPEHPALTNGMVLGARLSRPIFPWLVPEVELPLSLTTTDRFDASVLWMEPRLHVRFEFLPDHKRVQPFLLVGGGAAFTVSSKSDVFANDLVGEGYFGIGAHAVTGRGFQLRADVRFAVGPGAEKRAILEVEVGIGLWVEIGGGAKKYELVDPDDGPKVDPDPDLDRILGAADKCTDRAEDEDGFDDADGCPDIDNDLDHVLDIADKCATVSESFNGYEDDDGCPDSVPPELDDLEGTIEGLTYSPGETALNSGGRRTVKKIAKLLAKYPSVRIRLIGYTDDREFVAKPEPGDEPTDPAQAASELALERAAVMKAMLIGLGLSDSRIQLEGKGPEDPVGDNDNRRGRQANRRVVLKRFVPAE